jgi:TolA-binding protein
VEYTHLVMARLVRAVVRRAVVAADGPDELACRVDRHVGERRGGRTSVVTVEETSMRFVVAPLIVAALLLAGPMAPAQAQVDSREGIALQNQIYQLRQELKSLEDQTSRGGGAVYRQPPPAASVPAGGNDLLAQLLTRVDGLEEQVRQLRGRIDETQNQVQRQNDELGKRIDDLAFQISPQGAHPGGQSGSSLLPPTAGQGLAPPQPAPPPIPPPVPRPAAPPGPRTPELALQEGNAALARRDYAAAEAAAREVLSNRTSPRAYDAQFLLAQALAGERQFPQAAVAYDDVYNRSRTGSHAEDARLGLASALTSINEKKAACDVLSRMPGDFPHLRPDISAGMAATAARAGCH